MRRDLARLLCLVFSAAALPATADLRLSNVDPVWKAECVSCHTGFPPQMLRAQDWKRLMSGLERHFGADAALTSDETQRIADYLVRNSAADNDTGRSTPELRLTTTPWFTREHRKITPEQWTHPEVKRASNCGACHLEADDGFFGHRVRIPGTAAK